MNQQSRNSNNGGKSPSAPSRWEKFSRIARFSAIYSALMVPAAVLLHYSRFELPWAAVVVGVPIFAGCAVWQWERATKLDRERAQRALGHTRQ